MKSALRKELRQLRDSVADKESKDKSIAGQFALLPCFIDADTVLLYSSSGSEVSTDEIFRLCLDKGKKVAFPLCLDKDGVMDFFLVESDEKLEVGMYGIKAPDSSCLRLEATSKCLCVVPGLAFDGKGYRIGYGKGYYDRYLSSFPGVSVGLCYQELYCDSLPVGPYDIKVNYLITDKMIYNYTLKEDLKYG